MSDFSTIARVFVTGVVAIGLATALFAPGRTTTQFTSTVFSGSNKLLATAEHG